MVKRDPSKFKSAVRFRYPAPKQKEDMARISSEKAALAVGNRYDLILIASARIRELHKGHKPKLDTKYGKSLTALREIEEGLVGRDYLKKVRDSDTTESKKPRFR